MSEELIPKKPLPVRKKKKSGGTIDQIFQGREECMIKQKVEKLEMLIGFETQNKYSATFKDDETLALDCLEESSFIQRMICKGKRSFKIHIYDGQDEVLMCERGNYLFLSQIDIYDPTTNIKIGSVAQKCACCQNLFSVYVLNEDTNEMEEKYKIWSRGCCYVRTFHIKNPDEAGDVVGKIAKKWGGVLKEAFTDADSFGVVFPPESSNREKAVLFGATFMIDFLFFEDNNKK